MKVPIVKGATSQFGQIFIQDSTATDGAGLTGLLYTSSGLTWYYFIQGDTASHQVTLADMSLGTWTSGGFKQIDSTGMPGWYAIGIPNAAVAEATNGNTVSMHLKGATNMVPCPLEIELTAMDDQGFSFLKKNRAFTAFPFVMRDKDSKIPTAGYTVTAKRLIDSGSLGTGSLTNVVDKGSGLYTVDGAASDVNGKAVTFVFTGTGNADTTIVTILTLP